MIYVDICNDIRWHTLNNICIMIQIGLGDRQVIVSLGQVCSLIGSPMGGAIRQAISQSLDYASNHLIMYRFAIIAVSAMV